MAPTTVPSTVTLARLTVCTSARTPRSPSIRKFEEAALDEVGDDRFGDLGEYLLVDLVRGGQHGELVPEDKTAVAATDQREYQRIDLLGPAQPGWQREKLPIHRPALRPDRGLL